MKIYFYPVKMTNNNQHHTALQQAILFLKSKRIIKNDTDLGVKMGYSKGTVSAYVSGSSKPSEDFLTKFENVFNIKLSDYSNDDSKPDVITSNKDELQELKKEKENLSLIVKDQAASILKLIAILESSKSNSDSPQDISSLLGPYLQIIAAGGVGKFWSNESDGRVELGKILNAHLAGKTELHKH